MNSNLTIQNIRPPGVSSTGPVGAVAPVGASNAERQNASAKQDASQAKAVDPQELEAAVSKLSEHAQRLNRSLEFSIDEDSGRSVITVMDSETEQVIRQIPSEITLEIAKQLHDFSDDIGQLMSETA